MEQGNNYSFRAVVPRISGWRRRDLSRSRITASPKTTPGARAGYFAIEVANNCAQVLLMSK